MVQIEILSGPESGQIFDLDVGTHTLGRAATCSRVLGVESVSGRHLELTVSAAGELRFRDLGSTNGTWSGGVQVADGEWFPGSELKLGNCKLRFVPADGAPSATTTALEDDDSDIHRRAREAAMSGKRKGGPLQMVLGLVLVVAAGGGAWWTFGSGSADEIEDGTNASTAGADGTNSAVALDAIDGYGNFEDPEAWSLSKGTSISDGRLNFSGERHFVRLSKEFDVGDGSLGLRADISGSHVFPQISWGSGSSGNPATGTWEAADLANGPVSLNLPADAEWFQLALRMEGQGAVTNLKVETVSGSPSRFQSPLGNIEYDGANLWMSDSSGTLLTVRGQGGTWSSAGDGLLFTPEGDSALVFTASGGLLAEGSFLILADGGPVGLAPGVAVESSPGILLGGGAKRLLLNLTSPSGIRFESGGAKVIASEPLNLRWDLAEAMTQSARLSQRISRAERDGDDRELLASAAELLRDFPLDELKVQEALLRSREALERGRSALAVLQVQARGAIFVGAESTMEQLADEARALAMNYPGTSIEPQANQLGADLKLGADKAAEGRQQAAEEYRASLQGALDAAYPVLASWLKEAN